MKTIAKAFLLMPIIFCFAPSTLAATFVVNTTADTADVALGNGACADASANCSLRAAISEANALVGADIITLGADVYTQSLAAPDDNSNAGGDWDITSDITINGAGQAATILQAGASASSSSDRVLEVLFGGNLTLTNVTVRNGRSFAGFGLAGGGGIANSGTLLLDSVTVRDNRVISMSGGGIGGGIYNMGTAMTLNNTTVTANETTGASPGAGFGGGVASSTTLTATVVITNSTISGNHLQSVGTAASGGGLYLGGVFNLTAAGSHFDSNSTLSDQQDSEGGGARLVAITGASVFNITNCTFNGNAAGSTTAGAVGGGLHLYTSSDTLTGTLDRVAIDGNHAQGSLSSRAGGLYVNPVGGAINVSVTNSAITNNVNSGSNYAGGVEISDRFSPTVNNSLVNFTNTTISGNSGGIGGGAHVEMNTGQMTVNMNFVTIANNTASISGGGFANSTGPRSVVNLKNSIIADNSASGNTADIMGALTSQDYNHIENPAGGIFTPMFYDTTAFDPQLGPLQNNGGSTLTHLPSATSPIADSIPLGINGCGAPSGGITTDQRIFGRPFGGNCDKGAAERGALAAGPWSLSGVIKTATGQPIRNVAVTLSGGNLPSPVMIQTGNFGTYGFTNLVGNEYTVTVVVKRYHFNVSSQVFALGQNITDADFVANAPFSSKALDQALDQAPVKDKRPR